jgi:hypothetical protein
LWLLDNKITAFSLYKLTEQNRNLASDHLIKANAPNAKNLCTGKLDFAAALNEIASESTSKELLRSSELNPIIDNHTQTVRVNKSVREASVDLSQAYIMNLAMLRLLNHFYKQDRSVLDNFRPNG